MGEAESWEQVQGAGEGAWGAEEAESAHTQEEPDGEGGGRLDQGTPSAGGE